MNIYQYRTTIILSALMAAFIILPSFVSKDRKARTQKISYEFPVAMSEEVRQQFTQECDRGQALYNLVCADCHNRKVDGNTILPNWSTSELVGYELRVLNPKHEAGLPEEQVSAEELGYIMTFLTYKKKSGQPLNK